MDQVGRVVMGDSTVPIMQQMDTSFVARLHTSSCRASSLQHAYFEQNSRHNLFAVYLSHHFPPPFHSRQEFILNLLEKDPNKRMTAKVAAMHPWVRNGMGHLDSNNLTGNIQTI